LRFAAKNEKSRLPHWIREQGKTDFLLIMLLRTGLVDQGIIELIKYSTPWLHPIKERHYWRSSLFWLSKTQQICSLPRQSSADSLGNSLQLAKGHFAVFDVLKGYYQIPSSDESKDLTLLWPLSDTCSICVWLSAK
jgi:hypothetical protein